MLTWLIFAGPVTYYNYYIADTNTDIDSTVENFCQPQW